MSAMTLRPAAWAEIEHKVRALPEYADPEAVSLQPQALAPAALRPLCLRGRTHRLAAVEELIAAYRRYEIELFRGVWASPAGGREVLVPPPIVELHEGRPVLIDGLHRVYCALCLGVEAVWVVVIAGKLPALPAEVLQWAEVEITAWRTHRREKFRGFNRATFRHVKRYIDRQG